LIWEYKREVFEGTSQEGGIGLSQRGEKIRLFWNISQKRGDKESLGKGGRSWDELREDFRSLPALRVEKDLSKSP